MISRVAESFFPPGFSREAPATEVEIARLPPLLRALLVADGTVTKLLEAYFWSPIEVRVLAQELAEDSQALRREVVLASADGSRRFAYARSTIQMDQLEESLRSALLLREKGIGALLREEGLETRRELCAVTSRVAGDLAPILDVSPSSELVERTYAIHRNGKMLMEITEIFPVEQYRPKPALPTP
jgi:chorismate-pyruvate lyase